MLDRKSTTNSSLPSAISFSKRRKSHHGDEDHPAVNPPPMMIHEIMAWSNNDYASSQRNHPGVSSFRSMEQGRTIACSEEKAPARSVTAIDHKPKLTFFHKTNEMVLRDGMGRVCAVIIGSSSSSSSNPNVAPAPPHDQCRQFKIYGVTPIFLNQNKAQGIGQEHSTTVSRLKDENKDLALYEWAVIEKATRRRGRRWFFFRRRLELILELNTAASACASEPATQEQHGTTTTTKTKRYIMKTYRGSRKEHPILRDRKQFNSTTTTLGHKMVANTSSSTSPPPSPPSDFTIAPGMDPCSCVFFLACAEEFIVYML